MINKCFTAIWFCEPAEFSLKVFVKFGLLSGILDFHLHLGLPSLAVLWKGR